MEKRKLYEVSCKTCKYRWRAGPTEPVYCDYLCLMGRRRPGPGGAGCTEYIEERADAKKTRANWDTDRARELWDAGGTDAEIAAAVDVPRRTVSNWRNRSGLSCNKELRRTWDTDRARELWEDGGTDAEIAAEAGVSRTAVMNWRKKEGLPSNSSARRKK